MRQRRGLCTISPLPWVLPRHWRCGTGTYGSSAGPGQTRESEMSYSGPGLAFLRAKPPIAILGVPFDHVTSAQALDQIRQMVASREPHYLVTPNVDFLVQARKDVELRRILFEAHLVLCDGTPLVWISRLLGNALPERVAGADLVPLLISVAEQK